ncbi:hypothetical protein ACFQZ4_02250 [Catellatospora coxensis]
MSRRVALREPAMPTVSRTGSDGQADVLTWRMGRVRVARAAKRSSQARWQSIRAG